SPAAVSRHADGVRSNRRAPKRSSICRSRRDSVGWLMRGTAAAREIVPFSATARTTRKSSQFNMVDGDAMTKLLVHPKSFGCHCEGFLGQRKAYRAAGCGEQAPGID